VGGVGYIAITSSYSLSYIEAIPLVNKYIAIQLRAPLIINYIDHSNGYAYPSVWFSLNNSGLDFFIDTNLGNGQIIENENTTGLPLPSCRLASSYHGTNYIGFRLRIRVDNYHPIIVNESGLATLYTWSNDRTLTNITISGHYPGTNRNIIVNKNNHAYLVDVSSGPAAVYINYSGGITDTDGNSLSGNDLIRGIIRDSNGLPRNVVSNLIL
jgi:hypothetical protein